MVWYIYSEKWKLYIKVLLKSRIHIPRYLGLLWKIFAFLLWIPTGFSSKIACFVSRFRNNLKTFSSLVTNLNSTHFSMFCQKRNSSSVGRNLFRSHFFACVLSLVLILIYIFRHALSLNLIPMWNFVNINARISYNLSFCSESHIFSFFS